MSMFKLRMIFEGKYGLVRDIDALWLQGFETMDPKGFFVDPAVCVCGGECVYTYDMKVLE